MTFRIAAGEAATAVVFVLHVDHDRGSLPAVGILAIFLDRLNASLPTEGSDQGDVHDFPPATRHNKHGDTRGVWMPGHRVGVGGPPQASEFHIFGLSMPGYSDSRLIFLNCIRDPNQLQPTIDKMVAEFTAERARRTAQSGKH